MNIVTKDLYAKYHSIDDFANANVADVEEIVRPCGFFKTKARDIVNMCIMLRDQYHGKLPDTVEELIKLPGVGRKTANLVVGDIYHKPAVVCDTHCIRITNLLGLSTTKDPKKVARMMQAAMHEFAAQGYRDAKTDAISSAAAVSKGLLFHYYGSKQGLYFATVQLATETIIATINRQFFVILFPLWRSFFP